MSLIPVSMARPAFRAGLILKKHSPSIMFGAGIAGSVASTVMACRATLKLAEALPEMKDELDDVKLHVNGNDRGKTLTYVYGLNTARVVKLYAPSVIIGAASIGLLTGSHVTLNRRNAGLTAAYAAVAKAYDEYRERVKTELGEEKELGIYHAASVQTITNEEGKEVKALVADSDKWSPYARFFDECSTEWVKNAEMNKNFVMVQQNYLNHLLHSRGHVFLNEAYDRLGFERTKEGAVVGWVSSGDGDNYIDFGLNNPHAVEFMRGWERSVLLDFNVDGVIYDQI